ncbi:MAG: hypothetical protein ACRD12_09515 [Acidimicrobiales bacterium]
MSTDRHLTCARDGVATRLRCANCDVAICPACLVRTEVGLRCPACGNARPGSRPPRRHRHVGAVAVFGAIVLAGGIVAALARQDAPEPAPAAGGPPPTQILEFEPVRPDASVPSFPPRLALPPEAVLPYVERPDLGIAFAVPSGWEVSARDPAGGVFLATPPLAGGGPIAWFRILTYPGAVGVAPTAQRVTAELLADRPGVRDLVSNPTVIGTRPAWYVRFTAPLSPDGSGPPTEQTFYFIEVNQGVAALAFGSLGSGGTGHAAVAQATIASLRYR